MIGPVKDTIRRIGAESGHEELHGSKSEILHVLGNDRRIEVVFILEEMGNSEIDIKDLSHKLTERLYHDLENDDKEYSKKRHSVYVSLQQVHLDTLEDINAIEFKRGNKVTAKRGIKKLANIIREV